MTPNVHNNYRIGLPEKGKLTQIFNSDDNQYGGSGVSNPKPIKIENTPWNGKDYSAEVTLPPLSICIFKK
jgi:1,4-alpha-glucan branching enzyme